MNKKKRALALGLAATQLSALTAVVAPLTAFAETPESDEVTLGAGDELLKAVGKVKSGGTIKLAADFTLNESAANNAFCVLTKDLIIDLNGHTLTTNKVIAGPNHQITIKNGKIAASTYTNVVLAEAGTVLTLDGVDISGGRVTVNNGTAHINNCNITGRSTGDGDALFVFDESTVTVTGGSLKTTSAWQALTCGNGQAQYHNKKVTVTLTDVEVENAIGQEPGIYIPETCELTLKGTTTVKGYSGIAMKTGSVTIGSGVTVTGTGAHVDTPQGYSNGSKPTGAAIDLEENSDYLGGIEVTVESGATLVSENSNAITYFIAENKEMEDNEAAVPTLDIKEGATLTPSADKSNFRVPDKADVTENGTITKYTILTAEANAIKVSVAHDADNDAILAAVEEALELTFKEDSTVKELTDTDYSVEVSYDDTSKKYSAAVTLNGGYRFMESDEKTNSASIELTVEVNRALAIVDPESINLPAPTKTEKDGKTFYVAAPSAEDLKALNWSPVDADVGRNYEGYWYGMKVFSPLGLDAANYNGGKPKYQKLYNYIDASADIAATLESLTWTDGSGTYDGTGTEDGQKYMEGWNSLTYEYIYNCAKNNKKLVYGLRFDWDGDGTYEQTAAVVVNLDKVDVEGFTLKESAAGHTHNYAWGSVKPDDADDVCKICGARKLAELTPAVDTDATPAQFAAADEDGAVTTAKAKLKAAFETLVEFTRTTGGTAYTALKYGDDYTVTVKGEGEVEKDTSTPPAVTGVKFTVTVELTEAGKKKANFGADTYTKELDVTVPCTVNEEAIVAKGVTIGIDEPASMADDPTLESYQANQAAISIANWNDTAKVVTVNVITSKVTVDSGNHEDCIALVMKLNKQLDVTFSSGDEHTGHSSFEGSAIENVDVRDGWMFVDGADETTDKGKYVVLWIAAGSGKFTNGVKTVDYKDKDGNTILTVKLNEVKEYKVTSDVTDILTGGTTNAEVTLSPNEGLNVGDEVIVTVKPKTGYALKNAPVLKGVNFTKQSDGSYKGVYTVKAPASGTDIVLNVTVELAAAKTITIIKPTGGTLTTTPAGSAAAGAEITVTAKPSSGYKGGTITVTKTDDPETTVTVTGGKFTMPDYDVTVSATFTKKSTGGSGSSGGGSYSGGGHASGGSTSGAGNSANEIAGAASGSVLTIESGAIYITGSAVKEAADKELTLIVPIDGKYVWTFKPSEMEEKEASVFLEIIPASVNSDEADKVKGLPVTETIAFETITNNLGKSATLTVKTSSKSTETDVKYANLYRVDYKGALEFIAAARIDAEGKAVLPVKEKGTYAILVSNETKLPGDLNNDCTLNVLDAVATIEAIVYNATSENLWKLDLNHDGVVNVLDVVAMIDRIGS